MVEANDCPLRTFCFQSGAHELGGVDHGLLNTFDAPRREERFERFATSLVQVMICTESVRAFRGISLLTLLGQNVPLTIKPNAFAIFWWDAGPSRGAHNVDGVVEVCIVDHDFTWIDSNDGTYGGDR